MAKRIVFQGDSITDAGRNREDFYSLGYGYPLLVAAHLTAQYPGQYEYVNRGIGGNLLVDLYERRQADLLDLAPDYFTGVCSPVSYGADDSQILYPEHSTTQAQFEDIFPNNVPYVLDKNFRCTREIMQCVRQVFPNAAISANMINNIDTTGHLPSLIIGNWGAMEDMPSAEVETIIQIIQELGDDELNIAILLPWKTSVQKYANALHDKVNDFSFYYEDTGVFPDGCPPLKNVHITTFKSAKGLEFDAVIIPDFHKMNSIVGKYHIDWQDYYVGCTRARRNLYLFSNKKLPLLNGVVEIKTI